MTRMMMAAGLALAVSAGAAMAADPGKDESGKGRERAARELRFHRHEARVGRGCDEYRSHLEYRFSTFFGFHEDERCKHERARRHPPIWRGYPQSR
jgi:hypothetical protein